MLSNYNFDVEYIKMNHNGIITNLNMYVDMCKNVTLDKFILSNTELLISSKIVISYRRKL